MCELLSRRLICESGGKDGSTPTWTHIEARSHAEALELMRAHILGAGQSLLEFLQEQRGGALPKVVSAAL